ncbi:hypothetical protein BCR36DRAFT_407409 [Piromyces finnis]|uniref:Uncharacterized protein n=1 Tax=Piromyces finnis TaxID=1754191 RepID=A0A1Y1UW72_9FUNG|nr:hypothetical protein BCR36DRAFT_407409 [Piromyces finnis]|eukprot:ORX41726.1 hypothetical protein BCR36DRAFT_407409 [Piromyces finnis]
MITTQNISDNSDNTNNINIISDNNTDVNKFWDKNSLSSVYNKSNIISKDDLEKKKESENIKKSKEFERNTNNSKLHNALIENFKNESADINRLLLSRKIIEETKEEADGSIKYTLPKSKNKEEFQDDMEKTYYDNDFQNENIFINNVNLNFDEEIKINEKYSQIKDFYNIFTEQEINERIQKIVAKVIPEESKKFKTSLPLFDALGAIENMRSKYITLVDKLNNINDIYEEWVEERERSIVLNYQTAVAKYEKYKNVDHDELINELLKKNNDSKFNEKEIENLILSNNSLNNKVDEITSELQNTQKENRLIYNIIGKLRIKNKLLCKKLKEIIIKKNITLGELEMDKKLDNNDEDEEEKDILKSYDGKNIEKSLLLKEIDKINTEIENTNSEILCCLTNIKEKKKWK